MDQVNMWVKIVALILVQVGVLALVGRGNKEGESIWHAYIPRYLPVLTIAAIIAVAGRWGYDLRANLAQTAIFLVGLLVPSSFLKSRETRS